MKVLVLVIFIFISQNFVYSQIPDRGSSEKRTEVAKSVSEEKTVDFILGERDPFSPPKYIRELEFARTKGQASNIKPEDIIDNQMEAIRRWPLSDYKLIAIIWDVKNPKAMIVDRTNTMHLLKKNYRIGNREGVITEINESEIVVLQKGTPIVIQILRSRGGTNSSVSTSQNASQKSEVSPNVKPGTVIK